MTEQFRVDASAPVEADGEVPAGLLAAFWRYERALMADDVAELDRLFAAGEHTIRSDVAGVLVGHDAISAFRRGRGGAPKRRVNRILVQVVSEDAALVVAVVAPLTGGSGSQTQLWQRQGDTWSITAAQVSGATPAMDSRVWRSVGSPLMRAAGSGALDGETVAVKDLFAISGHRIGAGVPAYLAEAGAGHFTAPAVSALLEAGADVAGIARTDEFAYSIAGVNPHYGTPPNAVVPGALPGGSSSGPASAVALGQVSIGLATDTAGSIRVPASYQGLWGLRTSHGAVSTDGVLPLAPSFDTVGWLTRDPDLLHRIAETVIGPGAAVPAQVAIAPDLLAGIDEDAAAAFRSGLRTLVADGRIGEPVEVTLPDASETFAAFRTVQAAEAWRAHGAWLRDHPGAVSGAVAERFAYAATVTPEQEQASREALARIRAEIDHSLEGALLALPAAASAAPAANAPGADIDRVRTATLQLTCYAGVLGAPSISAPLFATDRGPLGLSLVGPRGSDAALVQAAAALAD